MFLSLIPRKAPGTSRIKLLGLPQIHRGKPFSPKKINKISPVTHCASRALVPRADNRKAQVAENTKQETFPLFQLDISTKTFGVAWEIEVHTHHHLIHHQAKDSVSVDSDMGQVADPHALSVTNALLMSHATKKRKNEILWAHELH
ncbi:hypothetical protein PDIG_16740 [Penicillium digitatum PHI26]|uniref:Uncharacterized protein n=2 Tax=Penicillium digitatum TaxID=36651 RepID=K9G864_PEND2|nr:hypothetical protein PDIP_88250 [Penicillium digitatum Pd1]EKV04317.1 hypothetical protein PDIP_88250 [Penicillium digitatum Pd1]EKV17187.1 hypothetical protein PDIG_16740 [Penicillium digitatum PHI26]